MLKLNCVDGIQYSVQTFYADFGQDGILFLEYKDKSNSSKKCHGVYMVAYEETISSKCSENMLCTLVR